MKKKLLTILLSVFMIITSFSTRVFADVELNLTIGSITKDDLSSLPENNIIDASPNEVCEAVSFVFYLFNANDGIIDYYKNGNWQTADNKYQGEDNFSDVAYVVEEISFIPYDSFAETMKIKVNGGDALQEIGDLHKGQEGYLVQDNVLYVDVKFQIAVPKNYVAQVGDTKYETIDEAIGIAKNKSTTNDIIQILVDKELYITTPLSVGDFFLVDNYRKIKFNQSALPTGYQDIYDIMIYTLTGGLGYKFALEKCVAQNTETGTKYTTLQKAVTAANSGDTIKLLTDINYGNTERQGILIGSSVDKPDREITIDLNGKTYEGFFNFGAFITQYGKLTIVDNSVEKNGIIRNNSTENDSYYAALCSTKRGTIVLESGNIEGNAYGIYQYSVGSENLGNTVIINGGTVEVAGYGISAFDYGKIEINGGKVTSTSGYALINNGSDVADSTMTINGGTINGAAEAIYHPGPGVCTINGGTLVGGETGIEMRAGTLTVNGGSITGNAKPTTVTENGNGMTSSGVAVAVAQHTTKLPINISINGGKLYGFTPLYESNPQNNSTKDINKIKISVSGGDFACINNGTRVIYSEDFEGFITGGFYTHTPDTPDEKYIAPGYIVRDTTVQEKTDHGSRYLYTLGIKESGGNVVVENDNLDDDVPKHYNEVTELQDAIDNVTKANQEKLDNNQTVTETVITVTNGTGTGEGINAEIDDTIVIVAKTNEENSVVGLPGYGVEETKNEGKSTYTATALDIGYAKDDVQGSPSGTGKNVSKQINTINSGKQGVTISPEVLTSAGTVVDTTDNEYIKQIVADIVTHNDQMRALKLNQATAAKAINNAEKDINNNDVTIKVTTDGTGTDEVEAKTISIFVETYYKTVVTDDKTTQADKSYTLDITPMYQAYASTTNDITQMKATGVTTVAMGEPKELENLSGKNITLKVQLPENFIDNINQKVYVIHKTKTYNTTVTKESNKFYIEFTNPDGFSAFEITLKNPSPTPGPTPSSDPKPGYKIPKTGVEGMPTNNHSLLKLSSLSLLAIGSYLVIKKKKDN